MLIISTPQGTGINFFYPLFRISGRRRIRLMDWGWYQRIGWLLLIENVALILAAVALMKYSLYDSEKARTLFSATVVVNLCVRIRWVQRFVLVDPPPPPISARPAPVWVFLEFASFYGVLAAMDVWFLKGEAADSFSHYFLVLCAVVAVFSALLPIFNLLCWALERRSRAR